MAGILQAAKWVSKLLDSNTHSWSLKAYHTTISIISITIITDITWSYVGVVFILKTDKNYISTWRECDDITCNHLVEARCK